MSDIQKIIIAIWGAVFVAWIGMTIYIGVNISTVKYTINEFPNSAVSDNIFVIGDDGENYIVVNADSKNVLKKYPQSVTKISQTLAENEMPYAEVELYSNGEIKGVKVYLPCDMSIKFEKNLENVYILRD
ncbi:MAG: hypothetical protein LBM93_12890 [Oscillospiraceae bacterium]|jgi:hypothetical protein|nr:hypothetical protein [Oscillospiraceae bacterium]